MNIPEATLKIFYWCASVQFAIWKILHGKLSELESTCLVNISLLQVNTSQVSVDV